MLFDISERNAIMDYLLVIIGALLCCLLAYLIAIKLQVNDHIYKLRQGDNETKLVREILTKVRFISIICIVYAIASFLFFSYLLSRIH